MLNAVTALDALVHVKLSSWMPASCTMSNLRAADLKEDHFFNTSLDQQLSALIAWEHSHVQLLQGQKHSVVTGIRESTVQPPFLLTAPASDAVFLFMIAFISA